MMNAKKSSARSSWKYLFLVPLFGLSMICLNAFHLPTQNVMILESYYELQELQQDLNKQLKADGYIKSKRDKVSIKIPGHQFVINGEVVPAHLYPTYDFVLHQHEIQAVSGKVIIIHQDGMEIGVGYKEGRNNIGSWLFSD